MMKTAKMCIRDRFRSYNRHDEVKNRLVLSVFAREIEFVEEELDGAKTCLLYTSRESVSKI